MQQIGRLDKRVTLQKPTKTADGMGGFTTTWSDYTQRYCAIWPVTAKEIVQNSAVLMLITHKIRIKYLSVVDGTWRIKYRTRYFEIKSIINPEERNEWLDLLCLELK